MFARIDVNIAELLRMIDGQARGMKDAPMVDFNEMGVEVQESQRGYFGERDQQLVWGQESTIGR